MQQIVFLRGFLTQETILTNRTLNRENDSMQWHHWLMSGLWSTTHCPYNCKNQQS